MSKAMLSPKKYVNLINELGNNVSKAMLSPKKYVTLINE